MARKRKTTFLKSPALSRPQHELEAASIMLGKLRDGHDVRTRRTRRLRGAVRAGRYESPLKLQIALIKLLEDTAGTPARLAGAGCTARSPNSASRKRPAS